MLNPVTDGAARIIAGHGVDALTNQLFDKQPGSHLLDQGGHIVAIARHDQVLRAACIGSGLQTQAPRRITAEHITLQFAVCHDVSIVGRDSLTIVSHTGHSFKQMRPLLDRHEFRKNLLANGIQQERRAPVLGAAGYRADRVADKAARELRREQDRNPGRLDLARTQSIHGALRSSLTDIANGLQISRIAGGGVMVVALHLAAFFTEHDATNAVTGFPVAADKAMRITIRTNAAIGRDRGTLGVLDERIVTQSCLLTLYRQRYGLLRAQLPRVVKVEIRNVLAHQLGVRQTGMFVLGGVIGKSAGFLYDFTNRCRRHVRGARIAFALIFVDGNPEATVIGKLQVFHFAQPGSRGQPLIVTRSNLGLINPLGNGLIQRDLQQRFQFLLTRRIRCGNVVHVAILSKPVPNPGVA